MMPPEEELLPVRGAWPACTLAALLALVLAHLVLRRLRPRSSVGRAEKKGKVVEPAECSSTSSVANIVTEEDLKELIGSLRVVPEKERDDWEEVVSKGNDNVSYQAWRNKKTVGPPRYLSVTTFERCSPELLRDFYMDTDFRKEWDNTILSHDQLQVDDNTGTEVGRTIKKFPFLTPREYVLAWRVWEGQDNTFYCFNKECEHALAPYQKKYVRVSHFRSGWCIRKVPGADSCEIKVVHEEANGMNVEMAKLAFAKGIWNYVCKMDRALRSYSRFYPRSSCSVLTMRRLMKKVPPSLEIGTREIYQEPSSSVASTRLKRHDSLSKRIAKGVLLVGTIACLSQASSSVGAQVAMACILKKLTNNSKNSRTAGSTKGKNIKNMIN